jgi:hypothetical protein
MAVASKINLPEADVLLANQKDKQKEFLDSLEAYTLKDEILNMYQRDPTLGSSLFDILSTTHIMNQQVFVAIHKCWGTESSYRFVYKKSMKKIACGIKASLLCFLKGVRPSRKFHVALEAKFSRKAKKTADSCTWMEEKVQVLSPSDKWMLEELRLDGTEPPVQEFELPASESDSASGLSGWTGASSMAESTASGSTRTKNVELQSQVSVKDEEIDKLQQLVHDLQMQLTQAFNGNIPQSAPGTPQLMQAGNPGTEEAPVTTTTGQTNTTTTDFTQTTQEVQNASQDIQRPEQETRESPRADAPDAGGGQAATGGPLW